MILLHLLDQNKIAFTHVYDVAHLAELASVVQKMDLTHLLDKSLSSGSRNWSLILIYWTVIYPLDGAIQLLYNRCLYFIFIYCLHNLSAWHRLSVRLLQVVILIVIFSHLTKNFIGSAKRVQIKNVVLLL